MTPVSFLTEIHLTYIGTTQGLFPTIVKPKFYEFIMLALLITGWGLYSPETVPVTEPTVSVPLRGWGCIAIYLFLWNSLQVSVPLRGFDFSTVFYHISTKNAIKIQKNSINFSTFLWFFEFFAVWQQYIKSKGRTTVLRKSDLLINSGAGHSAKYSK